MLCTQATCMLLGTRPSHAHGRYLEEEASRRLLYFSIMVRRKEVGLQISASL